MCGGERKEKRKKKLAEDRRRASKGTLAENDFFVCVCGGGRRKERVREVKEPLERKVFGPQGMWPEWLAKKAG